LLPVSPRYSAQKFQALPISERSQRGAHRAAIAANSANLKESIMTRRIFAVATAAVLAGVLTTPVTAQRNSKDGAGLTLPFSTTGTLNGSTADVAGTFTVTQFAVQDRKLVAIGTLAATVRDTVGVRTAVTQLTVPVNVITGGATSSPGIIVQQVACGILHLELGPLDLDLLGLVVHLDRVVLDISAEPGSGNLLGNLLCAIANLLNGGSPLTQILNHLVNLLNQLIAAL
jgi:hypothetical protein